MKSIICAENNNLNQFHAITSSNKDLITPIYEEISPR